MTSPRTGRDWPDICVFPYVLVEPDVLPPPTHWAAAWREIASSSADEVASTFSRSRAEGTLDLGGIST